MKTLTDCYTCTDTAKSVIKTLLYFDIFQYPLTAPEILQYLGEIQPDEKALQTTLDELVEDKLIFRFEKFYLLQHQPKLITKRLLRNELAQKYIQKAIRITKIISRFPYIRMVSLSGSVSKNSADEDSDVDYFIITDPNRVWVARFFLILFKKLALFNSNKYFCINLVIDKNHLEVAEKTHYIATEIVSLIPLYGRETYLDFLQRNLWTNDFFPNVLPQEKDVVFNNHRKPLLTVWIEKMLNNQFGDKLDTIWQETTRKRWKKHLAKTPHVFDNPTDYIDIQSHTAKGHSLNHYPRIRNAYQRKIEEFENKFGLSLMS